jgi:hypothetical protein
MGKIPVLVIDRAEWVQESGASRSDFRIRDLMNCENPVSLYIITQLKDKALGNETERSSILA